MKNKSKQKTQNQRSVQTLTEEKYMLVEALAIVRNTYLIGYYFCAVPIDGRTYFLEKLSSSHVWDTMATEYKSLAYLMNYRHIELKLWKNYKRGLERALIKDSFELTLHYCKISGQYEKFKKWKNYRFFKLVKDAMFPAIETIIRWTYGNKSIIWRKYVYTSENDGVEIRLLDEEGMDLQKELQEFVDKELN